VGFTSCKKDKDNNAPEYKGEMVKTQFSLNLPSKVGGMRKMPGATVQADGENFRGIESIRLIPYTVTLSGSNDTPVPHDASALTNMFTLTNIDGWSEDTGNKHAKVYNDVQIPVGTNAFLFYGKAMTLQPAKTSQQMQVMIMQQKMLSATNMATCRRATLLILSCLTM
jgi:hypothetical protein